MAEATDFRTSDKVTNSLFKGAGFNKQPAEAKPTEPARPAVPSRAAQQAKPVQGGDRTGADIDFASLPEDVKMAAHLAATKYNGNVDPQKWATYWAQSSGCDVKELTRFATYVFNIMRDTNVVNPAEIPPDDMKYPWWSAARDWSPNAIGAMGNRMSNAFTPSSGIVDAITSRF